MPNELIWVLAAITLGIFILIAWLVLTLMSSIRRIDGTLAKLVRHGGFPISHRPRKEERDG